MPLSLLDLPPELLRHLCYQLQDEADLLSLLGTCKYLFQAVWKHILKEFRFEVDMADSDNNGMFSMVENRQAFDQLRNLNITCNRGYLPNSDDKFMADYSPVFNYFNGIPPLNQLHSLSIHNIESPCPIPVPAHDAHFPLLAELHLSLEGEKGRALGLWVLEAVAHQITNFSLWAWKSTNIPEDSTPSKLTQLKCRSFSIPLTQSLLHRNCKTLQRLDIGSCSDWQSAALVAMPQLKYLKTKAMSIETSISIADASSNLEIMELYFVAPFGAQIVMSEQEVSRILRPVAGSLKSFSLVHSNCASGRLRGNYKQEFSQTILRMPKIQHLHLLSDSADLLHINAQHPSLQEVGLWVAPANLPDWIASAASSKLLSTIQFLVIYTHVGSGELGFMATALALAHNLKWPMAFTIVNMGDIIFHTPGGQHRQDNIREARG